MTTAAACWRRWVLGSIRQFGWAPVLVMGVHLSLSKGTRLYASVPDLDIAMHFIGGAAIGFFFWRAVGSPQGRAVLGPLTVSGQVVTALGLSCSSTVIWEFAEWTTDHLGLTRAQAGLPDTMLDMAMGVGGALLVLLIAALRRSR